MLPATVPTFEWIVALFQMPAEQLPPNEYYDYYGPEFRLTVQVGAGRAAAVRLSRPASRPGGVSWVQAYRRGGYRLL